MERHSSNALAAAQFLEEHEAVEWVNYPGLPSHPSYDLAQKYLPKGQGAILTFGIKGGVEAGKKVINAVSCSRIWRMSAIQVTDYPPGQHDASAAGGERAAGRGRRAGHDTLVRRHGRHRRYFA